MKRKKAAAFLAAVLFVLALPLAAGAKEWGHEEFTIDVPDDMYVFTPETSLSDPAWALAGIDDPAGTMKMYTDKDTGMNAIANFISKDKTVNILLTKKSSGDSASVHNLHELSAEEKQEFLDKLVVSGNERIQVEGGLLDVGELTFFTLDIAGEGEGGAKVYEKLYGTVVNGYTLAFDTYSTEGEIPQGTVETMENMVHSIHFDRIIPASEVTPQTGDMVQLAVLSGGLVLLIAGTVVFVKVRDKRDKKSKKELADRLAEYRRTHANENEAEGQARFVNATECGAKAIRAFSIYHAYIKNMIPIAVGIIMSVVLLVVTLTFDAEWWMKLLSAALVVYYIYKLVTASSNIEKVQRRIYSMGTTNVARYSFYNEAFRVSGIQSVTTYPYFQITELKVTKDFIYLYYGPDNAYIMARDSFAIGTDEEFIRFIKGKRAEK